MHGPQIDQNGFRHKLPLKKLNSPKSQTMLTSSLIDYKHESITKCQGINTK